MTQSPGNQANAATSTPVPTTPVPVGRSPAEAGGRVVDYVDLTEEEPRASFDPYAGVGPPETRNIEGQREEMRGVIAIALLVILAFIVVAPFIALSFGWASMPDLEGLLTIMFAPIIGIVGAVTGFYFGERSAERSVSGIGPNRPSSTEANRQP